MRTEEIKELIEAENITYGTVWTEDKLCEVFGIQYPDVSSHNKETIIKNVETFKIKKMNAYSSLNEKLIDLGMCFIQDRDTYRVPLISEITSHINKYYESSTRKFKRAEKLRKSFSNKFPAESKPANDKINRVYSMRESENKMYRPLEK